MVPDAIEPYYGIKWLYVNPEGRLYSHTASACWPEDGPLVAKCMVDWGQEWRPVPRGEANYQVRYDNEAEVHGTYNSTPQPGWVIRPSQEDLRFEKDPDEVWQRVRTTIVLPPNLEWSWEPRECPHEAPDPDCACGIYVVQKPKQCENYKRSSSVLVKVALWGHLVPGTEGCRGQFGYPVEVLDTEGGSQLAELVEQRYRIEKPKPVPKPEPPPVPSMFPEHFEKAERNWRDKLGF